MIASAAPLRLSVFSVVDHYPDRARTLPQLYQQIIDQAKRADQLGFDSFFVAEHHFHPYGAVPAPPVMLAAIAQRTRRIRLGPAIAVLPFHHPLNLAESYAMLDVLSDGRVVLGVGSGYLQHEFDGYGIDPADKRARFDEALAILKRALSGEEISFSGRFHSAERVRLNVKPLQAEVPIYVAVLDRLAAYHVGRQGNNIMSVPYASVDRFDEVAALVSEFRRGADEAGNKAADGLFAFHTHVADSDAECRREAAAAFDLYVETRLYAKRQTYDDVLRSGLSLLGSVETVSERLAALYRMGVRHVLALMNFGMMPPERVERTMDLLIYAVLPRVNAKIRANPGLEMARGDPWVAPHQPARR